jgi:hypothetical protein
MHSITCGPVIAPALPSLHLHFGSAQAGKNIGTVARRWSNHIKPDGWALSIWLLIYTLLIGFVVWQYRSTTPRASEIVNRIGWLFVASSACSAGWVIVYVQGTTLSAVIAMLLMWTLVGCNVAICWKTAWRPADAHGRELAEVLVVDLCFSIYAGWGEFRLRSTFRSLPACVAVRLDASKWKIVLLGSVRGGDRQRRHSWARLWVERSVPLHTIGVGSGDDCHRRAGQPRKKERKHLPSFTIRGPR